MTQSIYDKLDTVDLEISENHTEDQLDKIKEEVSALDYAIWDIVDEIEKYSTDWKEKSFGEVEEFMEVTVRESLIKLNKIRERLY